jgi:hypothetical protein
MTDRERPGGSPERPERRALWWRAYGVAPLQLLALLAALSATGWAVSQALRLDSLVNLAAWFLVVLIGHDLIFLPLYSLLERIATFPAQGLRSRPLVPAINHVRAPAFLCALMLLVYAPLILGLGSSLYRGATGHSTGVFLPRWLALSALAFGFSGAIYVLRVLRARRALLTQPPPRGW